MVGFPTQVRSLTGGRAANTSGGSAGSPTPGPGDGAGSVGWWTPTGCCRPRWICSEARSDRARWARISHRVVSGRSRVSCSARGRVILQVMGSGTRPTRSSASSPTSMDASGPAEGDVVWVEGRRTMRVAPVDPGALMAQRLFARRAVVLLSATMGAGERFEPLARRVGLDPDLPRTGGAKPASLGYQSLRVASPFDYREQRLLYVPRALPEPNDPTWPDAADAEIAALVDAAGGRTLVLCTSNAAVTRIAGHLREVSEHAILAQGGGSKRTLIETFIGDETSCLVATRSFWVGIDVPGVSCVLVVIDRIPFARPDDPMVSARRELAQRDGKNPFFAIDLPRCGPDPGPGFRPSHPIDDGSGGRLRARPPTCHEGLPVGVASSAPAAAPDRQPRRRLRVPPRHRHFRSRRARPRDGPRTGLRSARNRWHQVEQGRSC
jgi:hypothetical protein